VPAQDRTTDVWTERRHSSWIGGLPFPDPDKSQTGFETQANLTLTGSFNEKGIRIT